MLYHDSQMTPRWPQNFDSTFLTVVFIKYLIGFEIFRKSFEFFIFGSETHQSVDVFLSITLLSFTLLSITIPRHKIDKGHQNNFFASCFQKNRKTIKVYVLRVYYESYESWNIKY